MLRFLNVLAACGIGLVSLVSYAGTSSGARNFTNLFVIFFVCVDPLFY
jgi:hypothetical protein